MKNKFLLPILVLLVLPLGSFKPASPLFFGTFDDLLREARRQKKQVLLDFTAEWCLPCKKMESETFSNPEVAEKIQSSYLVYKIDAESFDGMDLAEQFTVEAFPTYIVLDTRGKEAARVKGFWPAGRFIQELQKDNTPRKQKRRR